MGKILAFPPTARADRGTVHAYRMLDRFEIGHESASGDSWGYFETFDCPQLAVAAAYRLNREVLGNSCSVSIATDLLAALPVTPSPVGRF